MKVFTLMSLELCIFDHIKRFINHQINGFLLVSARQVKDWFCSSRRSFVQMFRLGILSPIITTVTIKLDHFTISEKLVFLMLYSSLVFLLIMIVEMENNFFQNAWPFYNIKKFLVVKWSNFLLIPLQEV